MARRNKNVINTGRGMRRGQTIVAEREQMISDSERLAIRKKAKMKKVYSALIIIVVVMAVVVFIGILWVNLYGSISRKEPEATEEFSPTVEIEDEGGSGLVTARMREYVGMLEADFSDAGYKVVRAVVPAGKTREIDIYLNGRNEFYKTNLDRGTGVTVEDAVRMMRYLDQQGIAPSYVDVRVAGKGYYR